MPIYGFLASQEGRFGSFKYVVPELTTPRGAGTGAPIVAGASESGRVIATSGWANTTIVLKVGDILRFLGHTKVYMVTADVTSDATGLASITLNTPVQKALANGEQVVIHDVEFTVELMDDNESYDLAGPGHYSTSVNMREIL